MRVIFYWFNLGAAPGGSMGVSLLARELVDAGHAVTVIHFHEEVGEPLDYDRLFARSELEEAGLHALSFGGNHADLAAEMAQSIRARYPDTHILCGGVHTTLNAEEVLAQPAVDAVCIGEADGLLTQYVAGLAEGGGHLEVDSFWTKQAPGQAGDIRRNPVASPPSLEHQGLPYFDGIDYPTLIRANRGFVEVMAHRGCPLRCSYCHNAAILDTLREHGREGLDPKGFCRQRPVESLLAELEEYQRRYPAEVKVFNFADDTLVRDVAWLRDFARGYADRIGLPFVCNAHLGEIDDDVIELLADAGCNLVKLGVESGSARLRTEILRRPLDEERLGRVVGRLQERGVNVRAYVMLGIPTESTEERRDTIRLCARLRFDSVRPAILHPYPGTRIHQQCVEWGLLDSARIARGYNTHATLRVSESERVEIERSLQLFAWLLNLELGGEAGALAKPVVEGALALGPQEWTVDAGRALIHATGTPVHEALRAAGVDHFYAPFINRHDVVFLYRDRARPLLNVDDV